MILSFPRRDEADRLLVMSVQTTKIALSIIQW